MQQIEFVEKHLTVALRIENGEGIVSSTYLWYMQGLVVESKSRDSWYPTKILISTGPSGLPIVMPSVCLYMVLLKLNSTKDVAVFQRWAESLISDSNSTPTPTNSTPTPVRFRKFF